MHLYGYLWGGGGGRLFKPAVCCNWFQHLYQLLINVGFNLFVNIRIYITRQSSNAKFKLYRTDGNIRAYNQTSIIRLFGFDNHYYDGSERNDVFEDKVVQIQRK